MPRLSTIEASAINIKLHPHSTERYIRFFERMCQLKRAVKLRGSEYLRIGSIFEIVKGSPANGFRGEIFKWTGINKDAPWLDERMGDEANRGAVEEEVNLPDHMKPNFRRCDYAFFPRDHLFVFETNSKGFTLTAGAAMKLIFDLATAAELNSEFGEVEVELVKSAVEMRKILDSTTTRRLEIEISIPNPDDFESEEKELEKLLAKQNARKYQQVLVADRTHEGLKLNDQTEKLVRLSRKNGQSTARVEEDGRLKTISTKNKAETLKDSFDGNLITRREAFIQFASMVKKKLAL